MNRNILPQPAELPNIPPDQPLDLIVRAVKKTGIRCKVSSSQEPVTFKIIRHAAKDVFEKMLWLNPRDNQGVRFLLADIDSAKNWYEMQYQ